MPFNHNDVYHRLMLRQVPAFAGRALDVGCGFGYFARRLAARGIRVDAVDPSAEALDVARTAAASDLNRDLVRWVEADITTVDLPGAHYDVISCLASIHHVPFDTVTALRRALAPGGALLILGCYREAWPADLPVGLVAVPTNAAVRLGVAVAERVATLSGRTVRLHERMDAPATRATMTLREIRAQAADLLPGATIRRLLFWRYLLVYRKPIDNG